MAIYLNTVFHEPHRPLDYGRHCGQYGLLAQRNTPSRTSEHFKEIACLALIRGGDLINAYPPNTALTPGPCRTGYPSTKGTPLKKGSLAALQEASWNQ